MTVRVRRGSVGPVRKRAVLAASLALTSVPVSTAYGFVPAPPKITYAQGIAPGTPDGVMSPAQTDMATGTIYYTQPLSKYDKAHEVFHVLDGEVFTDGDRRYFQKLMHAPPGAWNQGSAADTGGGPSEWAADYYAAAAVHMDPRHEMLGNYAQIGPRRLRRFQQAIERLGKRHHLQAYQP